MICAVWNAPIGSVALGEEKGRLVRLWLPGQAPPGLPLGDGPALKAGLSALEGYFRGCPVPKDLPLAPQGTPFQRAVWAALEDIPWGETRTYGQLAAQLGRPGAARAVGQACHRNPLPIFIPCHRVVGADGSLTGFAGGLACKEALLRMERERPL
ncbi:MAG: methylated-DNA--[protein]-cysteine S-methyltransferase [Clostridiales bacterium]|nr:methylated-DNA--[protein]-cysteine S-methyltransferase [Clostridiales bacterium]